MEKIASVAAAKLLNMKWYTIVQNNSGGYFVNDDNVCEVVCIQAPSASEAMDIASEFCSNHDSCDCCGDRWDLDAGYAEPDDVPSLYGVPIATREPGMFAKKAKLHYFGGLVETVEFGHGLLNQEARD